MTIVCPACNGAGNLPPPVDGRIPADKSDRVAAAKALARAGYSYRQIASLLGYRSTSSVHEAIRMTA